MKKITIIISIFLFIGHSYGQNSVDALRYSRTHIGGTARYMGMSGAFGALGADISTFSVNPAGIGLYKSSEFVITPCINVSNTNSVYNGTSGEESKYNFNLSNLGVVISKKLQNDSKWKIFQFGASISRHNNFHQRVLINGVNSDNSITNTWVEYANGTSWENIEEEGNGIGTFDLKPAWWTYLIDTISGDPNHYQSAAPDGDINQIKYINTTGYNNEVNLTMGANYNDRLYIGATLGFPSISYSSTSTYTETALKSDIADNQFRELTYQESLTTTGTGINLKLGMIFRATDWLRLGGAFHTPTFYTNLTDNWETYLRSDWDIYESESKQSPIGTYFYELNTPLKAIGSVAIIIGQYGLISADYEYVDYSTAKLRADDYNFFSENNDIKDKYTSTANLRLGTEWRFLNFSFRGGYAIYGSPFNNNINDGEITSMSLGMGYREKNYFVDIAWVSSKMSEDYYLYGTDNIKVNPAAVDYKTNNFLVTVGYKF
ncbi:MAG: outer membrane protein transport protein [Bacteroidales bacterium]|nr:outer membrane protein transport protein [Bacteroidales bacterium]